MAHTIWIWLFVVGVVVSHFRVAILTEEPVSEGIKEPVSIKHHVCGPAPRADVAFVGELLQRST